MRQIQSKRTKEANYLPENETKIHSFQPNASFRSKMRMIQQNLDLFLFMKKKRQISQQRAKVNQEFIKSSLRRNAKADDCQQGEGQKCIQIRKPRQMMFVLIQANTVISDISGHIYYDVTSGTTKEPSNTILPMMNQHKQRYTYIIRHALLSANRNEALRAWLLQQFMNIMAEQNLLMRHYLKLFKGNV